MPPVAGYTAWYDASQVTGTADGTALYPADFSGNGHPMAASTKPTYYKTTGAHLINGNPAYWYSSGGSTTTSTLSAAMPLTIQAVVRTTAPAALGLIFGDQTASSLLTFIYTDSKYYVDYSALEVKGGAADTTAHVVTFQVLPGSASVIRVDGVQVATGTATPAAISPIAMAMGGASGMNWVGAIGEILYYSGGTALTPTQLAANESYLQAKWFPPAAITGTLTLPLGPLSLSSSGLPIATSAVTVGPLTVTAAGTVSNPVGYATASLGPLSLSVIGVVEEVFGYVPCIRRAWLVLGNLNVPLQNEAAGYFCQTLDLGPIDIREVITAKPDRDGMIDRTQYMGARAVSAQVTAVRGAGAQIDALAGLFAPFMSPAARPVLHYVLDRPGQPERTLTLRAVSYAAPIAGADQRDLQMQWKAADPVAYDPTPKQAVATTSSVGAIVTLGDVAARPLFRIVGPITGAAIQLVPDSSGTWYLALATTYTIAAGHHVDIDCAAHTVLLDGDPGKNLLASMDWTRSSWQWVGPSPSVTDMSLAGTGTSTATQVTAYWQDGYLT